MTAEATGHVMWSPNPVRQKLALFTVEDVRTRRRDRLEKPGDYAAAGIPHYWRIEQNPVHVFAYDLVDGRHELVADSADELVLTAPFPIRDITP